MKHHRCVALLALVTLLLAPLADGRAAVELQGFYEAFARGQSADGTWQMDMPNHYVELRTLATPWQDWELFAKMGANSNRFRLTRPPQAPGGDNIDIHSPTLFFWEGHARHRRNHLEMVAFTHENRFWFSQPLLSVIDGGRLGGSQAVRADFWGLAGFGGLAYAGDNTGNGEDFYVSRVFRKMSRERVLMGATFGRKNYGTGREDYDMAGAADFELALGELLEPLSVLGRFTLVGEVGRNFSGDSSLPVEISGQNGYQLELRDVRKGSLAFKGTGWYREPQFYSGLSGREGDNDRKGYFVELWWRLPRKQIDLRYQHWRSRALERVEADGNKFDQNQHELQLYMELKGGFSSWVKYRRFEGNKDIATGESVYQNLILELQAQNKLISARPQVRFRDFGTRFETNGYGMEINLNVTSRWKFFGRFLNADENTESRRTFFVQARYDAWTNAEFYIEYGDGGRSDRLTENDSFVGEGPSAQDQDSERRIQAIMKLWF